MDDYLQQIIFTFFFFTYLPDLNWHFWVLLPFIQVYTMKDVPETIFNGTFQLTSILRSVVGEDSSILDLVVRSGLLEELCNSLQWTIADIDVVSNIVRILRWEWMNNLILAKGSKKHFMAKVLSEPRTYILI